MKNIKKEQSEIDRSKTRTKSSFCFKLELEEEKVESNE